MMSEGSDTMYGRVRYDVGRVRYDVRCDRSVSYWIRVRYKNYDLIYYKCIADVKPILSALVISETTFDTVLNITRNAAIYRSCKISTLAQI